MQTCPKCSTQNRNNARFCATCGRTLIPSPGFGGSTGLLPPNAILQGRYLIQKKIGQGGMGAVYQAQDLQQAGTQWAIKEMSPALLTDPTERQNAVLSFHREFQLLAALDHPNLPKVVDLFEQDGKQFFVMEYVEGQTLEQVLQTTSGFLSEQTVLGWLDQVCDVLEYLHSRQPAIIFRDLKPANIMLTRDGKIKLIDFGIARFFKQGKTKDTASYGTMGFAAPEQFGIGQTDARSDVYSTGVVLHNLLTKYDPATTPFNLPPARTLNPHISEQTEAVIEKATRYAPGDRYQSSSEMKNALHKQVQVQPLMSCQKCGRADETLRATAFLYVISIVVMSFKRGWSGIMCRTCRIKYGLFFTVVSLLFGWWGVPWGILFTIQAFFTNLFGGTQPKENNAPLLAYQGMRFLERGDAVRAYTCLSASIGFQNDPQIASLLNQVKPLVLQQSPHTQLDVPGTRKIPWGWIAAGAVAVIVIIWLGSVISNANSAANIPPTAAPIRAAVIAPTNIPPTAAPTTVPADAWVEFSVDLKSGPAFSFDTIGLLTHAQSLKIIGRDNTSGSDWILVRDDLNRQGWVRASMVNLNVSLSGFPYTQAPSTPTPQFTATRVATAIPTIPPTATKTPTPKYCPPNPALVQINNFLDTGLVIEFVGPTTANVYVPSSGSVKLCLGQGNYTYTSRAIGYTTSTNSKTFTNDATTDCIHWDWWPALGLSREGTCSSNPSDYYAP